jgi:hypothetical protein
MRDKGGNVLNPREANPGLNKALTTEQARKKQ